MCIDRHVIHAFVRLLHYHLLHSVDIFLIMIKMSISLWCIASVVLTANPCFRDFIVVPCLTSIACIDQWLLFTAPSWLIVKNLYCKFVVVYSHWLNICQYCQVSQNIPIIIFYVVVLGDTHGNSVLPQYQFWRCQYRGCFCSIQLPLYDDTSDTRRYPDDSAILSHKNTCCTTH